VALHQQLVIKRVGAFASCHAYADHVAVAAAILKLALLANTVKGLDFHGAWKRQT
jgi:hypothetical protein